MLLALCIAVLGSGLAAFRFVRHEQPRLLALPVQVAAIDRAQHTRPVTYAKIPKTLVTALVDTEDQTFWTNVGVSFEGIARAVLVDLATGQLKEGGSTLTQQLVRDRLLTPHKLIVRKIKEMLLALWLTRLMPKKEILTLYVNQVYLGDGAHGIAAAAHAYFGETVSQLTPAQCTLLAGLPQAPSQYNPLRHPRLARRRQAEVLQSMVSQKSITEAEAKRLLGEPWHLVPRSARKTG